MGRPASAPATSGRRWRTSPAPVAPGGRLFIALYRDQGWLSDLWLRIKQVYSVGVVGRVAVLGVVIPLVWLQGFLGDVLRGRNPFHARQAPEERPGVSRLHDWVDWLGGLPFEVASAPAVLAFYKQRHFRLENLGLSDGHGCNEFVFSRSGTIPPLPLREPAKTAP